MSAIVFDLDGTLVDSAPDMAEALNRVVAARGLPEFAVAEVRGFIGDGVGVLIRRAMAARAVGEEAFADWHDAYMAAYADGLCVRTRPYPGVVAALDGLEGRKLAVCTNKPQALADALLETLGLRARFAAVLGGDTAFGRKPDAAPLRRVAELIGAGGAVMVGDTAIDAGAATAAGWPMLLFTQGYRDRAPEAIPASARFTDWAEFPAALQGLGR